MYFVQQILILILPIMFLPPRMSCSLFFKTYLESSNIPSVLTTPFTTHWAFIVHRSTAGLSRLPGKVLQWLFHVYIVTATSFVRSLRVGAVFHSASVATAARQDMSCIVNYLQTLIKLNWFEMHLTIFCKYVSRIKDQVLHSSAAKLTTYL